MTPRDWSERTLKHVHHKLKIQFVIKKKIKKVELDFILLMVSEQMHSVPDVFEYLTSGTSRVSFFSQSCRWSLSARLDLTVEEQ